MENKGAILRSDGPVFTAFDGYKTFDTSIPEKNLMRAILENAIRDLNKTGAIVEEAREYLLNDANDHLYSFKGICEVLDIDPERIRKKVRIREVEQELAIELVSK